MLNQTRALQQQAQRLEEERTRRQAAEDALERTDLPQAGSDVGDDDARRLAVYARARAAIAELGSTSAEG